MWRRTTEMECELEGNVGIASGSLIKDGQWPEGIETGRLY